MPEVVEFTVGEGNEERDDPGTVYICRECMSAECGAENGRLLVRIPREQYEARENVCPRCDRVEGFCNCEVY